jgi:hypothetical protein
MVTTQAYTAVVPRDILARTRGGRVKGLERWATGVISALVLLLGSPTWAASGDPLGSVALRLHGHDSAAVTNADALRELGAELVKSSSFNTDAHPGILRQTASEIDAHYRQVLAGDCLIITYDRPVGVRTVGGDLSVSKIVIGLAHPEYADALFTLDSTGRVVAHEKYSGRTAVEVRRAVDSAGSR